MVFSVISEKFFIHDCGDYSMENNAFCVDCSSQITRKRRCHCRVYFFSDHYTRKHRNRIRFKCFYMECNSSLSFYEFLDHYQQRGSSANHFQPRFMQSTQEASAPILPEITSFSPRVGHNNRVSLPEDIERDLNLRENEVQSLRG